jgi:hypothetical protein
MSRISGTARMPYSAHQHRPDAQQQVDHLVALPLEVLELQGGQGKFGEHEHEASAKLKRPEQLYG